MTVLTDADIKNSVIGLVLDVCENPDYWNSEPFTIYDIDDLQNLEQEPARPYLFLITRKVELEPKWLPMVAVDVDVSQTQFQLGNVSRRVDVGLNVLCREEGEAARITPVLKRHMDIIRLMTFESDPPTCVLVTDFEDVWSEDGIVPPDDVIKEGLLKHWVYLENRFIVP